MKNYTTWEVIKKLAENPKLKFALRSRRAVVDNNVFCWENDHSTVHICFNIERLWTLEEEQVSFMEAIQAFKDGKRIKSVCGFNSDFYSLSNGQFMEISVEEIQNGKWFIEGEI